MIVEALLGKRSSPENPSVPLSSLADGDSMWDALTGGSSTAAGVSVNRKKALSISAFWRGVNLIPRDIAKIPLVVFERLAGGGKERAPSHPAFHLLRRQANPQTKAFDFKTTLQHHALTAGNGYAYIVRRADGVPLELWQLNPYATTVVRANGRLWYVTSVEQGLEKPGTLRKLPAEDVLHIKGLGFDGLVGYDVITYAKEQLGATLARRQYGAVFFANDATPGLVLEHPGQLKGPAQENIRKSWAAIHQGLMNKHKIAVLAEGMTARTLSVDARKSQLLELQEMDVRQVANIIGLPSYKLGDNTAQSYNSLEMKAQDYLDEAIDPWLVQWEEECTAKLLTSEQIQQDTHFVEFIREAIKRVDHKTQTESLVMEVNNGLLSINQAMAIRNRPGIGPLGDRLRMPANHVMLEDTKADQAVSDDLAFKREVVKQLINDGTIGDVIFNLMDGRKLLEEVNIDTYGDAEEPWLPVVATSGPLVSGETIVDLDGAIVGGDVLANETGVPDAEPPIAGDAGEGDGDEGKDIDLDDDDAVRAAFDRLLSAATARRAAAVGAHRALLIDAVRRMHRRVGERARRAAKKPDGFVAWLEDELEGENRQVFSEAVGPIFHAMVAAREVDGERTLKDLADTYFAGVRAALLSVAECQPGELVERVSQWANGTAATAPETFIGRVVQGGAR